MFWICNFTNISYDFIVLLFYSFYDIISYYNLFTPIIDQDLNCTFENKDTCGYTPMSTINKWTKRSRGELSNSDNAGPLFDHTSLDIKGIRN